jgi:putative AbiEi antitoxin of type IV toxin-antitoxin system
LPGSRRPPAYHDKLLSPGILSVAIDILGGMGSEIPLALQVLAIRQAGVLSSSQVIGAGMSRNALKSKVNHGKWRRIYPGVYATFTGDMSRTARLWAIALYGGPGARLSHETAAELLRLTDKRCSLVHLTIPAGRKVRPPRGVVIHRSTRTSRPWQPVGLPPHTFIEETIIDLVQGAANLDDVIALIAGAFGRRLTSEPHLRRAAAERKKLRWRRELDEIISMAAGGAHSVLEYRHDRDVQRAHGLPEPVKQARFRKPDGTNGFRDRYYPQYGGLVIELDGKRFHADEQRDRDQARDNQAAVTGSTLRYGWTDVTRGACETARQQADALRHRGWTGELKPCSPACRAVTGSDRARSARQPA